MDCSGNCQAICSSTAVSVNLKYAVSRGGGDPCGDGSCLGECYSACGSGCARSCSGSCDGCSGCGSGCARSCSGSCSGGCSYTCSGGCSGACDGKCKDDCEGRCAGGCQGCGGDCSSRCASDCENTCDGCSGCGSGCAYSCSGACKGGCLSTCNTACNTACTASNKDGYINSLGERVVKDGIMYAEDMINIKNAIQNEFIRRGRTGYTPYTVTPVVGGKILTEHGKKILDDCYAFDNSKDWRSLISSDTQATAASLRPAIDYIKSLMRQIVV